jgi:hypothetical protein
MARTECPEIEFYVYNKKLLESDLVKRQPEHCYKEDDRLTIYDARVIDYYGEFRGGDPYINPQLVRWAEKRGMYWEWENPEAIVLCD